MGCRGKSDLDFNESLDDTQAPVLYIQQQLQRTLSTLSCLFKKLISQCAH